MNTTRSNHYTEGLEKFHPRSTWVGGLALLGTLLLFIGVSISSAAFTDNWEEKTLPTIFKQLKQQNKVVKAHNVIQAGEESRVIVTCANGEIREYNRQGQIVKVKDANGKVTNYQGGMPVEERDGSGALISKTEYTKYDNGKISTSVKKSSSEVEMKIFDREGNVAQVHDGRGLRAYSNYQKDNEGKTTGYTEMDMMTNKMSRTELGENGDIVAKTDENGVRTSYEYERDAAGEITSITERDTLGNVTVKKLENGQMKELIKNGVSTKYDNKLNNSGKTQETVESTVIKTENGSYLEKVIKQFNNSGQMTFMRDKEGDHFYTYTTGEGGRILSRREKLTPSKESQAKPKDVITYYNAMGQVIGTEENGRKTTIEYKMDSNGNILMATESTTDKAGGRSFTQKTNKIYDKGKVIAQTDGYGRVTKFEYDEKGNRTWSRSEDTQTQYFYDSNNNMKASISTDYKSTTVTYYDAESKLPGAKIRLYNSGFAELTQFVTTPDGQRASYTIEPLAIKTTLFRDKQGEQPQRVISTKFNGNQTITDYTYAGDMMVASKEAGPQGVTETKYNLFQKPESSFRVDQFGREYSTTYEYNSQGKTTRTLQTDLKGKTVTMMNANEDPETIIRDNVIGYPRHSVEKRKYTRGILTGSESSDIKGKSYTKYNPITGLADEVKRVNIHGFPRENTVYNKYDKGGDIESSVQKDSRGMTKNVFDKDGLMTKSTRFDIHGFPKLKVTTYEYNKGEMTRSTMKDNRGTTFNTFNRDGLMSESRREKIYGYPRVEHTTYKYNSETGSMVSSFESDENGTNATEYNEDELAAVSTRDNKYGHARHQVTTFQYDGEGFMTFSKQVDLRGITISQYNIDGLSTSSMRYDRYGVIFSRNTLTFNEYDSEGFMTISRSRNIMSDTARTSDKDGLTRNLDQNDRFGLGGSRHKVTSGYEYDDHGRMQKSMTKDFLGTTFSEYDIHGDATKTRRLATIGLVATRDSETVSTFESDTGMTTSRVTISKYSKSVGKNFDPIYGTEGGAVIDNNFGLGASRHSETTNTVNIYNGLTMMSVSQSAYSTTTTWNTLDSYGVADHTATDTNFGIGASRHSEVKHGNMTVNLFNGLNIFTKSESAASVTQTWYTNDSYGVTDHSVTDSAFGIGASRHSEMKKGNVVVNLYNGLNMFTKNESAASITQTWYSEDTYGVTDHSMTDSSFGIGAARHSEMKKGNVIVNLYNGLNMFTKSESAASVTQTWYTSDTYGVTDHSVTDSSFGIGASRHSEMKHGNVVVNLYNGLNMFTKNESAASVTQTWYTDDTYGVTDHSMTDSAFGIGASRHSEMKKGNVIVNLYNGLNMFTKSESAASVTQTWYTEDTYGVTDHTVTDSAFGIGASRHSEMKKGNVVVNLYNGLNIFTKSESAASVTQTWYTADTYGVTDHSMTDSAFGIGASRHSEMKKGNVIVNLYSGLNMYTRSESAAATTQTWYTDDTYGVSDHTVTDSSFGIGAARHSEVKHGNLLVNLYNGLNIYTKSESAASVSQTWYTDDTYGVTDHSVTDSAFGIGASRHSEMKHGNVVVNLYNGLNVFTKSESAASVSKTWYTDDSYGVTDHSETDSAFGIGASRHSEMKHGNVIVNLYNGLNVFTKSESAASVSKTWYTSDTYGVTDHSETDSAFGIGASRHSEMKHGNVVVNLYNGLNVFTKSESAASVTQTWYTADTYGVTDHSVTDNSFGIGAARRSEMKHGNVIVNLYNGLNMFTKSESAASITQTWYTDDTYGVTDHSVTDSAFGIGASRHSEMKHGNIVVNLYNGLNTFTKSESAASVNKTWYTDDTYGVTDHSETDSAFGIGASRHSEMKHGNVVVNLYNGLNTYTKSESAASVTQTWYTSDTYGVTDHSVTDSAFGIGAARHSVMNHGNVVVNLYTGLNKYTKSESAASISQTWYTDDTYGVTDHSVTDSSFGIGAARHSEIKHGNIVVNLYNGLNKFTKNESAASITQTWYTDDTYGVTDHSETDSSFGIGAARHSEMKHGNVVVNLYTGLNVFTKSESAAAVTQTWYTEDTYGVTDHSVTDGAFGIGAARHSEIKHGNIVVNLYTGLNIFTKNENAASVTQTWYTSDSYGVTDHTVTDGAFGIGAARHSEMKHGNVKVNLYTGLNIYTKNESAASVNETWYTADSYGVSDHSISVSSFGVGAARRSEIKSGNISVNLYNGLNKYTKAESVASISQTWYTDDTYGVTDHVVTDSTFGIGASRHSEMKHGNVKVNLYNGLNIYTKTESAASVSETWYTTDTYGVTDHSITMGSFGIGASRRSEMKSGDVVVNLYSGLNKYTRTESQAAVSKTWYTDDTYGVTEHSTTDSNFGIGASRHTEIKSGNIKVNLYNGLSIYSKSESAASISQTWYTNDTYGVTDRSITESSFGVGASRHSEMKSGSCIVNLYNGMNMFTKNESAASITKTWYTNDTYGVTDHSETESSFGIGASRNSKMNHGNVVVNLYNGLNQYTKSESNASASETWYTNDNYGVSDHVRTVSNFGIGAARVSRMDHGNIVVNLYTGLNRYTKNISDASISQTWYTDDTYGVSERVVTDNSFGIGAARHSEMNKGDIVVNYYNGQNMYTLSKSNASTTRTWYGNDSYGLMESSETEGVYGIGASRKSKMAKGDVKVNQYTGLNIYTRSVSDAAITKSWYSDDTYGVLDRTDSTNTYGIGASKHSWSNSGDVVVNRMTGLNLSVTTRSNYGVTTTWYSNDTYGVSDHSETRNNYGVINERHSKTTYNVDRNTGLTLTSTTNTGDENPPARTSTSYTDAYLTGGTYGVTMKTVAHNRRGPTYGQDTTTIVDSINLTTGMNIHTTTTSLLSTTQNYDFDPMTGVLYRSKTTNVYGTKATKNVQTAYTVDSYTGLNKESYTLTGESGHYYSQSWSTYDGSTGCQVNSTTLMNSGLSFNFARETYTTYTPDGNGISRVNTAYNLNGKTKTYNDANGLGDASENWSYYGVTSYTYTDIISDNETGFSFKTIATAYSRANGAAMSTSVTEYDSKSRGVATRITSTNNFGATYGRVTTTEPINYDEWGVKINSSSRSEASSSYSEYNMKGIATTTVSDATKGAINGRHSQSWTILWNEDTGIQTRSFSESQTQWSNQYYDDMGRSWWTLRYNKYSNATGSTYSWTHTTEYAWTGNPRKTTEDTEISQTWSTFDDTGSFCRNTETKNVYGANGDQHQWTSYDVNEYNGMNISSTNTKCNGDHSTSYYEQEYGTVTQTNSYNSKEDMWNYSATTSYDAYRGQITGTHGTNNKNSNWTDTYNYTNGQAGNTRSHEERQDGKKSKWVDNYKEHHYWSLNGLNHYDVESGYDGNKTTWFDIHGVKDASWTNRSDGDFKASEQWEFTQFNKTATSNGGSWDSDPTSSTTTFASSQGGPVSRVEQNYGLVTKSDASSNNSGKEYLPTTKVVTYNDGYFVKSATITYTMMDGNKPCAMDIVDNQGSEHISMAGYYQSSWMDRRRTNTGGSTMHWEYTDVPAGKFHTTAKIDYSGLDGVHVGYGTEEYTATGIINKRAMTNSNSFNETISYSNDGSNVVSATGTREDGMTTSYGFIGSDGITGSSDDKGFTTWDPATHKRTSTTGGFGTFSYTYSGDNVSEIRGTSAKDGSMVYDQYWNMKSWTDKSNTTHTYSITDKYKSYSTKATETFTAGGASWTGEVTYDSYGFYFKGEKLKATRAKVDQTYASNLVSMDQTKAFTFIKSALVKNQTEKETWSYKSQSDTRNQKTLGEMKSDTLTTASIKNFADAEITVNEDGTATAIFSNMEFEAKKYKKANRYKPVVTSTSSVGDTTSAPPSSTYSFSQADNVFYNGGCGYKILNVRSWEVAVMRTIPEVPAVPASAGPPPVAAVPAVPAHDVVDHYDTHYSYTVENWGKSGDGFMWLENGTEEQKFADKMTQDNNKVVASPVGTRAEGVQNASTSASQVATSVGSRASGVALSGVNGTGDITSSGSKVFQPFGATNTDPGAWGNDVSNNGTNPTRPASVTASNASATTGAALKGATTTPTGTEATAQLKAKLAEQLKGENVKNLDELLIAALGKMTPEQIANALAGSGDGLKVLMGALGDAYKAMFGETYQKSILGAILNLIAPGATFDSVKVAILGVEGTSKDAQMAAQKEQEAAKYASVVRDENGNIVEAVGKNGEVYQFSYEASGKTETCIASGKMTVKHFDNSNRLLSENSEGVSRTFSYALDAKGNVTGTEVKERTNEGISNLKYNQSGKLVSKEQNGVTQTFDYKDNGRVEVTSRNAQGTEMVKKVYEGGRLVSKADANGTTQYDYMTDGSGKVLGVTMTVTDRDGQKSLYKFNAAGEMTGKASVGATRFEKTEDNTATESMAFESAKDLFTDHRMVGEKLDTTQLQLQQVQQPQRRNMQ